MQQVLVENQELTNKLTRLEVSWKFTILWFKSEAPSVPQTSSSL